MNEKTLIRLLHAVIVVVFVLVLQPFNTARAGTSQASDTLRGVVLDEKGLPLGGATVHLVETGKETITDLRGVFAFPITGNPAKYSVKVSFKGYLTVATRPTGESLFEVKLFPEQRILEDVVVIGYGTQKKKYLLGAATTIGTKDFVKGAVITPEQLIVGKVAGVSITSNSGQPGVGSTIRIRGGASLNASNDPLFVIDGVPLSGNGLNGAPNPLSLINPADIETFTILKDAAATAIYGSRASNGVILITTKKGRSGKPILSFNTQLITSRVYKKVDVLSAIIKR
jgi:iron complex outermembrane receptor protein